MLSHLLTLGPASTSATAACFHPDGLLVATGTLDGAVMLWDAQTGCEVSTYELAGPNIRSVIFSPDGTLVAYGGRGRWNDRWIRLREVKTSNLLHDFVRGPHLVNDLAFSPSGELLASAEAAQGQGEVHLWRRGEIHVWRVSDLREVAVLTLDSEAIEASAVAFSPDGRTIAGGGADMSLLMLWDIASRTPLWKAEPHVEWTAALAFSPDGRMLASAGDDGTIQLRSVASASLLATLTGHQVAGKTFQPFVTAISFRPDGKLLASGSYGFDKTIRLWEVESAREIERIAFDNDVLSVAFSPDGRVIAGGTRNEPVKLFRLGAN